MTVSKVKAALSAVALSAAALSATAASAEVLIFNASNYTAGDNKHGLWTNNTNIGTDRFYAFQPGSIFTVDTDTGTGTFVATAINGSNNVAEINIRLGGFLETTLGSAFTYKQQGGAAYDPVTDTADVDFFTGATGTIAIDGYTYMLRANPFAGGHAFQYGLGANAKNNEFGASSWLLVEGENGEQPRHWDINVNLAAVPEPATWAFMIFGFGAVGGALRRKKARQTVSFA
ncbi:MAG: PEPxxWA-CTERM sorting domain-containing protein [Parasphingorhabdus sp.]|uniref:PEPxxWA-CTERM sorting domain-containing protein n=1 Tax=Parasphingorhabdus sp. TaxID=2709688 RepID=UPI003297AC3A